MVARVFELSEDRLPSVIACKKKTPGKSDYKPYVYNIPIFYFERYVDERCNHTFRKWGDMYFQHFPLLMFFFCAC